MQLTYPLSVVTDVVSLRFNDLDNIGYVASYHHNHLLTLSFLLMMLCLCICYCDVNSITGRHYSGFIMLGIQVFNSKDNYKFWNHECVEFNYRWLTEELKIDPDEITFIEDVWAGGGNLGPSIEFFVGGLELGNMVFMQYKVSYTLIVNTLIMTILVYTQVCHLPFMY